MVVKDRDFFPWVFLNPFIKNHHHPSKKKNTQKNPTTNYHSPNMCLTSFFWIPNKNHQKKPQKIPRNYQSLPMENLTIIIPLPQKKTKKKSPRNLKALDVAVSTPGPGINSVWGGAFFRVWGTKSSQRFGYLGNSVLFNGKANSWVWLRTMAAMLGSLIGLRGRAFPKKVECHSWVASTGKFWVKNIKV